MAKRLNQVAKELNIGISTIVDFLSKKGFNIKASINTKINEEQYNLLCKAFSTDALVKKIASKRNNLQLNLDDFIEHYNPINTEEKINELFKIYCETFHQPINEQQLDKLYQKCDNNLHTYIKSVYDVDYLERIYLNGDGAAWIKAGKDYLPNCQYVLDEFHLSKYLLKMTSHMMDT